MAVLQHASLWPLFFTYQLKIDLKNKVVFLFRNPIIKIFNNNRQNQK